MDTVQHFNQILSSFNIKATCLNKHQANNYVYYDLKLHPRAKVKDIQKYADEISLALKKSKPSVKVLHEQGVVRVEFASPRETPLKLFDLFTNDSVPTGGIVCLMGQTVDGNKGWV